MAEIDAAVTSVTTMPLKQLAQTHVDHIHWQAGTALSNFLVAPQADYRHAAARAMVMINTTTEYLEQRNLEYSKK
jgi:hypothetical protein